METRDIKCIDPIKGIFRATVLDDDDRRNLLSQCYKLKQSDVYKSVYIHRDLTYNQRQELYRKREAARQPSQGVSGLGNAGGNTDLPNNTVIPPTQSASTGTPAPYPTPSELPLNG